MTPAKLDLIYLKTVDDYVKEHLQYGNGDELRKAFTHPEHSENIEQCKDCGNMKEIGDVCLPCSLSRY